MNDDDMGMEKEGTTGILADDLILFIEEQIEQKLSAVVEEQVRLRSEKTLRQLPQPIHNHYHEVKLPPAPPLPEPKVILKESPAPVVKNSIDAHAVGKAVGDSVGLKLASLISSLLEASERTHKETLSQLREVAEMMTQGIRESIEKIKLEVKVPDARPEIKTQDIDFVEDKNGKVTGAKVRTFRKVD